MEKRLLDGIKIVDFAWAGVGPISVKYLADQGATVIHIESMTRPDVCRTGGPFKDGIPGPNRYCQFANYNTSKYSLALNLNHPKMMEVGRRLIQWADIVASSFTPKMMPRIGLSYEDCVKMKPDIIYFTATPQGNTGPHSLQIGWGAVIQALPGFYSTVGWPDRPPAGAFGSYTDYTTPRYGGLLLMAALEYKRRTGKGMCIDLSQFEAAIHFLGSWYLDYFVNGRITPAQGNKEPNAAPHQAYPCLGDDRWCVIAVYTDEEWKAFCNVIGNPSWTEGPKFSTLLGRKENEEELDTLIGKWTKDYRAEEVMHLMQTRGVAAGVVETVHDTYKDPQMNHLDMHVMLDHSEIGRVAFDGIAHKLSKTDGNPWMASPCLGEHTGYVCKEFLGMADDEIANLMAQGVFE